MSRTFLFGMACMFCATVFAGSGSSIERVRESLLGGDFEKDWQLLEEGALPAIFREPPVVEGRWVEGYRRKDSDAMVVFEFTTPILSKNAAFCRSRINAYLFSAGGEKREEDMMYLGNYRELIALSASGGAGNHCDLDDRKQLHRFTVVNGKIVDDEIERVMDASEQITKGKGFPSCFIEKEGDVMEIGVTLTGMAGDTNAYYSFLGSDRSTVRVLWEETDGRLQPARCEQSVAH